MKLGKAQRILLALTVLFVTFTMAFFIGRRSVHAVITTQSIPRSTAAPNPEPVSVAEPEAPSKIDLNQADQAQLEQLPGIGGTLAQRILDWREANGSFISTEQLMDIDGIGERKYQQIKDMIYVQAVEKAFSTSAYVEGG